MHLRTALLISALLTILSFGYAAGSSTASSPSGDESDVVRGSNAFAADLYGRLSKQEGNLFFSPESIWNALSITYAGARGATAREMADTLHIAAGQSDLFPTLATLLHDLNSQASKGNYQLSEADGLWIQNNLPLLPSFSQILTGNYGAQLNRVNFNNPERARSAINDWVEQQTAGKIKDLIGPGDLDAMTRIVIANAIYFKAPWSDAFEIRMTSEAPFHVDTSKAVTAHLMERSGNFSYFNGGTFSALAIPYKGDDLSMVVFLPNSVDGLPAFEQSMNASNLQTWLGQLGPSSSRFLKLSLPKFRMTSDFSLCPVLGSMGMTLAFDPRAADFSGMTGHRDLSINAVLHKAYVDVTEEGTEATAATSVGIRKMALRVPNTLFRADHPFVFLIRDNRSGSILFMGRVTDPSRL